VKGLAGLIRLHRWRLDEKRRALGALESLADEFRKQIAALDAQLRREGEIAQRSPDAARAYPSFLEAARNRRARLDKSLDDMVRRVAEAHGEVTRAYQELKRFEIAHDGEARTAAEAVRRHERITQDEIGLELYRRRGRRA
jgi:hypothetical protein